MYLSMDDILHRVKGDNDEVCKNSFTNIDYERNRLIARERSQHN